MRNCLWGLSTVWKQKWFCPGQFPILLPEQLGSFSGMLFPGHLTDAAGFRQFLSLRLGWMLVLDWQPWALVTEVVFLSYSQSPFFFCSSFFFWSWELIKILTCVFLHLSHGHDPTIDDNPVGLTQPQHISSETPVPRTRITNSQSMEWSLSVALFQPHLIILPQ